MSSGSGPGLNELHEMIDNTVAVIAKILAKNFVLMLFKVFIFKTCDYLNTNQM